MSDQAAAIALAKLAEVPGNTNARAKVIRWLLTHEPIRDRIDEVDLEPLVEAAARSHEGSEDERLERLKTDLESATPTTIVALFRQPDVTKLWEIPPVRLGPVESVIGSDAAPASGSWSTLAASARFAIRVDEHSIGARGAQRALDAVRAVLGALYLAGRVSGGGADTRLGPVPADELSPSVFIGPAGSLDCLVAAMRLPATVPLDLDELFSSRDGMALVRDCLEPDPVDLVQRRLRRAAPWIQFAFDALAFPDAVLGLGVALESLIGSDGTDVVRTLGMRTTFLLREGSTSGELALSGSDWRTKATTLYKSRSIVAHGRYEQGVLGQAQEREIRHEFEELLVRVAMSFRQTGREHHWLSDKDLSVWQEKQELG